MIGNTHSSDVIRRCLRSGSIDRAEKLFDKLPTANVSPFVRDLSPLEAQTLFDLLFRPARAERSLRELERADLAALLTQIDDARLVQVLARLNGAGAARLVALLTPSRRRGVMRLLQARATHFANAVRPVSKVMRTIEPCAPSQRVGELLTEADQDTRPVLFVVDREGVLLGVVQRTRLLSAASSQSLETLMEAPALRLSSSMPVRDVATLMARHELLSAPVVDERGRLLGEARRDAVEPIGDGGRDSSEDPPAQRSWRRFLPWFTASVVAGSMCWAFQVYF